MRQRDSEHTLQAYFLPFRPKNNSPFSRHYFTRVLLLCLWYDHHNPFRAKMQEENAPNPKIRGIQLVEIFFAKLAAFSDLLKTLGLISAGHPSWVSPPRKSRPAGGSLRHALRGSRAHPSFPSPNFLGSPAARKMPRIQRIRGIFSYSSFRLIPRQARQPRRPWRQRPSRPVPS